MREILTDDVKHAVAKLCIDTNCFISKDIYNAFKVSLEKEENELSRNVLEMLIENADIAGKEQMPICQDTGMTVVFVEIGQEVCFKGISLEEAINEGVALGYKDGFLRKSVVKDPIDRVNTNDNTPAVIHYFMVKGDKVKITVSPKGFGSENMSALKMLKPSQGIEGVKSFVIETVKNAGPNPCPPIIVGVGVGGTMEKAAVLSKQALLREVGSDTPLNITNREFWVNIEKELLDEINALGIGPAGLGGKTTALAVHINPYPTHIAGLPVAVNIGCHVTRHKEVIL